MAKFSSFKLSSYFNLAHTAHHPIVRLHFHN